MIISCPSCMTRYKGPQGVETPSQCCCSRCDAVFEPRQVVTSFASSVLEQGNTGEPIEGVEGAHPVLIVGVRLAPLHGDSPDVSIEDSPVAPHVLPIGLDDPTLADKVSNTALHCDSGSSVLTYHVLADEEEDVEAPGPEITIALEGSEERIALPEPSPAPEPAAEAAVEPEAEPVVESAADPVAEPASDSAPQTETASPAAETIATPEHAPMPGFGAFLVVAFLPGSLAAGAWQYSTQLGLDSSPSTPAAGVLGLLLSWLWIRWKYRTR